jgi:DNA modification methylase
MPKGYRGLVATSVEPVLTEFTKVQKGEKDYAILQGSCLELMRGLPENSIQTVITSPPYFGLRNYGTDPQIWGGSKECEHDWGVTQPRRLRTEHDVKNPESIQLHNTGANHGLPTTSTCVKCGAWRGELGLEPTPELFVEHLVWIFREVRRILREDGTVWLNIADSYWAGKGQSGQGDSGYQEERESLNRGHHQIAGKGLTRPQDGRHSTIKPKDLCLVPQRLAIALQADGWYVRSEVIWSKRNCMPESVTDRPTRSHEQIWLLTKSRNYYYDIDAIREPHAETSLKRIERPLTLSSNVEGRAINTEGETDMKRFCHPAGANCRTVWHMSTTQFRGKHYAGYPLDLPKRCILAGTSAHGRCAECGTPWRRDTETVSLERFDLDPADPRYRPSRYDVKYKNVGMRYSQVTDKGWAKDCDCATDAVLPCLVLDPFNGSGTTGLVALQNGRSYIGLELNPEYVQMTKERFVGDGGLMQLFGEANV